MLSKLIEDMACHVLERCDNEGSFTEHDMRNMARQMVQFAARARGLERGLEDMRMQAACEKPALSLIQGDRQ